MEVFSWKREAQVPVGVGWGRLFEQIKEKTGTQWWKGACKNITEPALGPVSRKSRKLFWSEKPSVKLRPACSVKLLISHDVMGRKIKITAKFRVLERLCFQDTKRIMSPEMVRDFRETGTCSLWNVFFSCSLFFPTFFFCSISDSSLVCAWRTGTDIRGTLVLIQGLFCNQLLLLTIGPTSFINSFELSFGACKINIIYFNNWYTCDRLFYILTEIKAVLVNCWLVRRVW